MTHREIMETETRAGRCIGGVLAVLCFIALAVWIGGAL